MDSFWKHKNFRQDLVAGLTVLSVLVPSAMAYGELAGLTSQAGLFTALVAMVVYAVLGNSRHLVIGPEATSALLTAMIVLPVAGEGADAVRFATLAGTLAMLMGGMLILGGVLRIGFLANFLSRALLTGYITGAAFLVIQSQLGKIFKIKMESEDFFPALLEMLNRLGETHPPTLILGIGTILVLLAFRRFAPRFPSSLTVVVVGIVLSSLFDWKASGIKIVGELKAGLPSFGIPQITWADARALLPGAASMALLAFSDAILTGRTFAARHGYTVNANRELIALGAANVGTALAGGFPVAASGSRTAVNESSGAQSKMSGVVAAAALAIFLLFFTSVLANLPVAVLGAIIIVASLGMIEIAEFKRMYGFRWQTFLGAVVTLLGVLILGIVPAILVAVVLSMLILVAVVSKPGDQHLTSEKGVPAYRPIGAGPLVQPIAGLAVYRLDGMLIFANCGTMKSRIIELATASGSSLKAIVLDMEMSPDTDLTSLATIEELQADLWKRGIRLMIAETKPWVRELFRRAGTDLVVGIENMHPDVATAMAAFGEKPRADA